MSAPFGRRGLALLFVIVAALAAGSASFAADQRMPEKHLSIAGLGAGLASLALVMKLDLLLPIAAGLLLYFLVPEYFRPMFTNPLGWFMLAVAAVMLAIGNVIIRRLTAIT